MRDTLPEKTDPFGFRGQPASQLKSLLAGYKWIRDDPRADPELQAYARRAIDSLRAELAEKSMAGSAVAA